MRGQGMVLAGRMVAIRRGLPPLPRGAGEDTDMTKAPKSTAVSSFDGLRKSLTNFAGLCFRSGADEGRSSASAGPTVIRARAPTRRSVRRPIMFGGLG